MSTPSASRTVRDPSNYHPVGYLILGAVHVIVAAVFIGLMYVRDVLAQVDGETPELSQTVLLSAGVATSAITIVVLAIQVWRRTPLTDTMACCALGLITLQVVILAVAFG